MEQQAFKKHHGNPKHKKKQTFGEGDDFYLAEQDGVADSYLTGFTTSPKAPVWGVYDDAMWTYDDTKIPRLIQHENISAHAKTFGGGAVAPVNKPPF